VVVAAADVGAADREGAVVRAVAVLAARAAVPIVVVAAAVAVVTRVEVRIAKGAI
jgi:hypothetical protein